MKQDEFDIRYSELEDGEHLKKWLMHPEDQRWYPMSSPQEVEDASRNWIGFSKFKTSLTATVSSEVCGIATLFLMPYIKVAHHALLYMIVDKKHRRKGIGRSLLKNILHYAKHRFRLESVHVEVFDGCPILPLLEEFRFQEYARQGEYAKEENGEYLGRILLEHFL